MKITLNYSHFPLTWINILKLIYSFEPHHSFITMYLSVFIVVTILGSRELKIDKNLWGRKHIHNYFKMKTV